MQIFISSPLTSSGTTSNNSTILNNSTTSSNMECNSESVLSFAQLLNPTPQPDQAFETLDFELNENDLNSLSPLLNMLVITPEQQVALVEQLQSLKDESQGEQDLSAVLAQWVASQPNPDQAFQKLGWFVEQGLLPMELNQVMAKLYAQLPMNQRMSLVDLQALGIKSDNVQTGLVHVKQSQSIQVPHNLITQNQPTMAAQVNLPPEMQLATFNDANLILGTMRSVNVGVVPNSINPPLTDSATTTASGGVLQQWQASVDVSSPDWGRELVDQLRARMQVSQGEYLQKAYVRLDPPELGRLEVTVSLEGDKASVHFSAAHPQLREALALNAERLRMDFDQNDLNLVDVSISNGMSDKQRGDMQDEQHHEKEIKQQVATNSSIAFISLQEGSRFETMV